MFSLNNFEQCVTNTTHPEQLRDILCLLFHEMVMQQTGSRDEITGFEAATDDDLHLAFYRTVNEMVLRWCHLRDLL
jgi:hypothetical protein